MARRLAAFVAMVAIIVIAIAVMWRVYLHHQSKPPRDEPTIVEVSRCSPQFPA